ncbi:MAG TPA: hypothetical protein VIJ32_08000 [Actinomycetes bacterium]
MERRPSPVHEVEWPGGGEVAYLEVQVVPLTDDDQVLLGANAVALLAGIQGG